MWVTTHKGRRYLTVSQSLPQEIFNPHALHNQCVMDTDNFNIGILHDPSRASIVGYGNLTLPHGPIVYLHKEQVE